MKPQTLEIQILNFLQGLQDEAKELLEGERTFLGGIEFLRSMFPNPGISRLASGIMETVRQKITPICGGLRVKRPAFILNGHGPQAIIALPPDWYKMMGRDPITELGSVVFVGSHAVDYAHDRFSGDTNKVKSRAIAYEAEFLHTVKNLTPSWEPCSYQVEILQEFP